MRKNIIVTNIAMEPISRVSWEKAAVLLVTGNAQNLLNSDIVKTVHSPSIEIDIHKVIYIPKYIYRGWNVRTIDSNASKKSILIRDKYQCAYCLDYGNTVDHIIPKSRGGDSSYGNPVACCSKCNGKKGDKTPEEAGMTLLYSPGVYDQYEEDALEIKELVLEYV